jgi:hypothetical protein
MNDPQVGVAWRASDRRLTVVAKRTYRLRPGGKVALADEQVPVVTEPRRDEAGCLVDDVDAVATKHGTDLVVKATAYAPGGRPARRLDAAVTVAGALRHSVRVVGDRVCRWRDGRLEITDPEPFTSMPITYDRAYGGSDESAREELDTLGLAALQPYVPFDLSGENPCVYARNPAGRGYLIHAGEHADGLRLPNIEDPADGLTAARLPVENAARWFTRPMPAGLGWLDWSWFPRSAFLGLTSELGPWDELPRPEDQPIREQRMGYLPADMFTAPKPIEEAFSTRALNGATPGLVLPFLDGSEEIALEHLDAAHPVYRFRLPGERPRLVVAPVADEPKEARAQLFAVIVEKDAERVSLVWGGSVIAKWPHGPEQLARVEARALW